jgi:hypothetical protein
VSADLVNFYILIGGRSKFGRFVSGNLLNLCTVNVRYVVDDDLSRRARLRLLRTESSLSVPQDHGGMVTQRKACAARSSERRVWLGTSPEAPP